MDKKKIIIIAVILLIIVSGVIFLMLTAVNYERVDITPNGATIEVPAKTEYVGNVEGAKVWNWNNGILVTYNSHKDLNFINVAELCFNTLNELIKTGEKQNIDGITCHVINAHDLLEIYLFDVIKLNYNGKFYCISLANETTHDNIIICANDRDIAVHMAKSVEYKNVYPENTDFKNLTEDLKSKANEFSLDDAKNTIEEYMGKLPI